jgi:hypothetical protein
MVAESKQATATTAATRDADLLLGCRQAHDDVVQTRDHLNHQCRAAVHNIYHLRVSNHTAAELPHS